MFANLLYVFIKILFLYVRHRLDRHTRKYPAFANTWIVVAGFFLNSNSYDMIKSLIKFLYNNKKSGLIKINNEADFHTRFSGHSVDSNSKLFKAYEKAWDARKFEIDNYWKRTTYFWAFQITSFTAYLAILNSNSYNASPPKSPEILYCIIAFGFITSLSWALINIGSKFWQRHWEKYIDILEDEVTGPL